MICHRPGIACVRIREELTRWLGKVAQSFTAKLAFDSLIQFDWKRHCATRGGVTHKNSNSLS